MRLEIELTLSPAFHAALDRLAAAIALRDPGPTPTATAAPPAAPNTRPTPETTSVQAGPPVSQSDPGEPPRSGLNGATAVAAPPLSSSHPAASAPAPEQTSWHTAARRALLRELYPSYATLAEIERRLAELPGPALPSRKKIGIFAITSLKLHRPADSIAHHKTRKAAALDPPTSPEITPPKPAPVNISPPVSATTPPLVPRSAAVGPDSPAAPVTSGVAATVRWTGQRIALLRRFYGSMPELAVLEGLNKLPGPVISLTWMHGYAEGVLHLKRHGDRLDAPASTAGSRVEASKESIRWWCESRGWHFEPFDINFINSRCQSIGHPGFAQTDA